MSAPLKNDGTPFTAEEARARFYPGITLELAIQAAREQIEEWSYEDDPDGYCHQRPILMRLVEAAELHGAQAPDG